MSERQVCVVLDTNQWDSHTLLRSRLSASFLFLLELHDGRLAIPDLVRTEMERHLREKYVSAVANMNRSLNEMRMIFGKAPDPAVPSDADVADAVDARVAELGDLVLTVPVEDRHHLEAGRMVLDERPPSRRGDQQFKDCLLWRAVMDLLADHRVLLVSGDGGFFAAAGDDLHPDLQREAERAGGAVSLVRSLAAAVAKLQETAPEIDLASIAEQAESSVRRRLEELIDDQLDVAIGPWTSWEADAFVTGRPDEVVVTFSLIHEVVQADHGDVVGQAETSGELTASPKSGTATDVRLDRVDFKGLEGEPRGGGLVVIRPDPIVIGPRYRAHELRERAPRRA